MTPHDAIQRATRPRRFDPVTVFFGETPPGPFALLGLKNEALAPDRVLQALQNRLEQLARHPQARTPAGEEVSLALHSAAAQLCEPGIQQLLLRTWGGVAGPIEAASPSLEREVLLAVGLSGGWNAKAMQLVALACAAQGASMQAVLQILRRSPSLIVRPSRSPAGHGRRSPRSRPPASEVAVPVKSESSIWGRDGILIGGIAAISIVLLIVVVVLLTPSGRQDVRAAPAVASIPVRPSVQKPGGSEPAADLESGQPRAIQREINGAAKDLSIDPGAATVRFKRAYEAFTRSWNLMSQDEIAAIVSSIVDYCYAASLIDPGVAAIVTEPLQNREPGRLNVRASAAAAAVSGRLLLERELPRETLDSLEERAVFASTGTRVERASTFREGLARNAPALVAEVVEADPASLENWKGIIAVRDAAFGPGQSERDTLVVLALESLLHRTTGSQSEFVKAVSLLAAALSWRPTEELRGAVFGWLEDATVPSPLLSALTLAMVSSSAPGVDSTMVLQPAAGPDARSDLRERLSATWLAEGTAPSMELNIPPDVGAWEKQTVALLEEKPSTAVERLRLAARFASQILLGEALRAGSQAASPADDLAPLPHTLPAAGVVAPGPDAHSKALDYYSAGSSVQARLEILKQFASQRPDLLMADLLVTEAARGSPAAIRDAARKEVVRNAADPSIVLAAIRALPSIPETPENAEWVGQLVGAANSLPKRAKWKPFAERALFDRACGMFPISPDEVAIASVVFDLAETWRERAGAKRVGVEPSAVTAIEQLQAAMSARSPLAKGGPGKLNPADIRRRLDARMVIAQTSMERAVALQSACAEWMALEVAREQPGAIGTVQSLVETWNGERRRAQSSVEQILEGERLMLRLEMLRLQKGAKL